MAGAWRARIEWRFLPSALLILTAVGTGIAALESHSPTTQSILVGAAFTALASALVDGVGTIEARRRERATAAVARRRMSRIRRNLEDLVRLVFDLPAGTAPVALLEEMPRPTAIDLSGEARIYVPLPKQAYALRIRQTLVDDLDIVAAYAATGTYTEAIGVLDEIIYGSSFGVVVRDLVPLQAVIRLDDQGEIVGSLTALLRRLDHVLPAADS